MTGNEMFLLKRGCGALGLDEIAKDIKEKEDNAMAMEFTKCIGELLRKNGVIPKITECTRKFETDKTFEVRYGVSIDALDFSEHDKVFEDKIASLEKQIERLMREKQLAYDRSEQLMKTTDVINSANKELKQKISDLESLMQKRAVFLEMKNIQIAELKQRIAELESKESVNPMRIEFYADNGEPFTPLEVANSLINLGYERPLKENEVSVSGKNSVMVNTFSVNDLKEIADYLNVYSRHHQEDTKTISF